MRYDKAINAKLIFGIIFNPEVSVDDIRKSIENIFGDIDHVSDKIAFDYTDYYEQEMGPDLCRIFFSIEKLIDPSSIASIKNKSGLIEDKYMEEGKRKINLDPGYIVPSKLVLASTKDFSHRIYMGEGIFTEITLLWRKKQFTELEWTFPDYRTSEYKKILMNIRSIYMDQM